MTDFVLDERAAISLLVENNSFERLLMLHNWITKGQQQFKTTKVR